MREEERTRRWNLREVESEENGRRGGGGGEGESRLRMAVVITSCHQISLDEIPAAELHLHDEWEGLTEG